MSWTRAPTGVGDRKS
uniref:Uncharacterized protein n=1 Tax=Arundo donax TaxID=35708 RepID=A0A0A9F1L4_ARUDO